MLTLLIVFFFIALLTSKILAPSYQQKAARKMRLLKSDLAVKQLFGC